MTKFDQTYERHILGVDEKNVRFIRPTMLEVTGVVVGPNGERGLIQEVVVGTVDHVQVIVTVVVEVEEFRVPRPSGGRLTALDLLGWLVAGQPVQALP